MRNRNETWAIGAAMLVLAFGATVRGQALTYTTLDDPSATLGTTMAYGIRQYGRRAIH